MSDWLDPPVSIGEMDILCIYRPILGSRRENILGGPGCWTVVGTLEPFTFHLNRVQVEALSVFGSWGLVPS